MSHSSIVEDGRNRLLRNAGTCVLDYVRYVPENVNLSCTFIEHRPNRQLTKTQHYAFFVGRIACTSALRAQEAGVQVADERMAEMR
jgi:hypothetical protein